MRHEVSLTNWETGIESQGAEIMNRATDIAVQRIASGWQLGRIPDPDAADYKDTIGSYDRFEEVTSFSSPTIIWPAGSASVAVRALDAGEDVTPYGDVSVSCAEALPTNESLVAALEGLAMALRYRRIGN